MVRRCGFTRFSASSFVASVVTLSKASRLRLGMADCISRIVEVEVEAIGSESLSKCEEVVCGISTRAPFDVVD